MKFLMPASRVTVERFRKVDGGRGWDDWGQDGIRLIKGESPILIYPSDIPDFCKAVRALFPEHFPDTATANARKGGEATAKRGREYFAEIGRKGAEAKKLATTGITCCIYHNHGGSLDDQCGKDTPDERKA
jgi:general stress protein YciG